MKSLLTTTALVIALGLPAASFAQDATIADGTTTATMGFLANRSMNQMLATDLIGHDVYARRTPMDMTTAAPAMDGSMANMTAAELDDMDNVGQITDLVLANDGTVAAVVIGVGGFLGVGEQDVAVTMNEVSFAVNADKSEDMYIIVNTSGEMLKTSPMFDRKAMAGTMAADGTNVMADGTTATVDGTTATADGTTATVEGTPADRTMLTAPTMKRDGYNAVKVTDVSIDTLIGKTVYGIDDSNVGTVSDVTVDAGGAVQNVVIDFGGFLGIGSSQVALSFDELTILTDANNSDIRVYVDATKDQIKSMPVYQAQN